MNHATSRVTIHMAASLDGFIARKDGRVDWLETKDEFEGGATLTAEFVAEFLKSIDCYVLGARTYETALGFEAQGHGWAYGTTPTFVLTNRTLPRTRDSVHFRSGDLTRLVNDELRPRYPHIWVGGGSRLAADVLRLGLADELRYSVLPVLIGDGLPFFAALPADIPLHLAEVRPYKNGMVELRYEVRREGGR
jgi:dihydrofolate reductase